MHRIDTSGAVSNHFVAGDPDLGQEATVVDEHFLNAVQDEIANVVEGAGLTLVKDTNNQLLAAIRALVAALPAWHYVGAGGEPAFGANFQNTTGQAKVRFGKAADGAIVIDGLASRTTGSNTLVTTLPATGGYRPTVAAVGFAVASTGVLYQLYIAADGTVNIFGAPPGTENFGLHAHYYPIQVVAP